MHALEVATVVEVYKRIATHWTDARPTGQRTHYHEAASRGDQISGRRSSYEKQGRVG